MHLSSSENRAEHPHCTPGIIVDKQGHILVSEYGENDRIQKFGPTGDFIAEWGHFGTGPGDCPVTEAAYEQIVSLPMFPGMSDTDVDDVIEAVRKVTEAYTP